jgi:hypothetical protein
MTERRHKRKCTFKNQQLLTLLLANDQLIISSTEDILQKAAYKLNKIITEHSLTLFTENKSDGI